MKCSLRKFTASMTARQQTSPPKRIGVLYAIKAEIRGSLTEESLPVRKARTASLDADAIPSLGYGEGVWLSAETLGGAELGLRYRLLENR